jgi:predicted short-subunit dehydrogenase-like oxidoreductase (DUF2520 family)
LESEVNKVAIIGAGKVGTAIGYLLSRRGYRIVGVASRKLSSSRKAISFIGQGAASSNPGKIARHAEIIFITTSDESIEDVCKKLARDGNLVQGTYMFHTCGALPSSILGPAKRKGLYIGSIHPLQSLADVQEAVKRLKGSYFCIEGDREALLVAKRIVSDLKGRCFTVRVDRKPLYHAGAAVVSNFLVSTVYFGLELNEAAGIKKKSALKALMPLIKGTIRNIEKIGIPSALTGPIARGDSEIVSQHLKSISKEKKEFLNLYSELGRHTVKIAEKKGTLNRRKAREILSLLNQYQGG